MNTDVIVTKNAGNGGSTALIIPAGMDGRKLASWLKKNRPESPWIKNSAPIEDASASAPVNAPETEDSSEETACEDSEDG